MLKIRSKYILKKIFENINQRRCLQLVKYNKKIQYKINISLKDYNEYNQIEFELYPILYYQKENIFSDLKNINKFNGHIYINNNKQEINYDKLSKFNENISVIKIKIDYEIK